MESGVTGAHGQPVLVTVVVIASVLVYVITSSPGVRVVHVQEIRLRWRHVETNVSHPPHHQVS